MFGKNSILTKIVCDNNRTQQSLAVLVQQNNRGSIIDMNPRVNDTLNVFYGQQMTFDKAQEIREYIEFQLSEKTDINYNFVEPTIIYHKKPQTEEEKENKDDKKIDDYRPKKKFNGHRKMKY